MTTTTTPQPIRAAFRRDPRLGDGILAGALLVLAVLELGFALADLELEPGQAVLELGLALAGTIPLIWRRTWPPVAVVVAVAAVPAYGTLGVMLAGLVAVYSAGAYVRWPAVLWVAGVVDIAVGAAVHLGLGVPSTDDQMTALDMWVTTVVIVGVPALLGALTHMRRARTQARLDRAEQQARQTVLDERLRIARELHDVVAHHVSVMGVQAGAARLLLDRKPEQVPEALSAIEHAGRQAVHELYQLLGVLRAVDGDGVGGDVEPVDQPGLDRLPELAAQVPGVHRSTEGEPRPLPRSIEISAYRVAQEAVTNTIKHAGGAPAHLTVRYLPESVEIEVVDDGDGAAPVGVSGGHGLVGMCERVAVHGGTFRAGPRPDGGFAVLATFPTAGVPA